MPTAVKERPAKVASKKEPKPAPPTVVRFEIERNDWCEILADAAVCAHDVQGFGMEALEAVHVKVSADGKITAYGTDRFTLARRTYHLSGPVGADVSVRIPLAEVHAMARIHEKPRRGILRPVQVEIVGERAGVVGESDPVPGLVTLRSGDGEKVRRVESVHPGGKPYDLDYEKLLATAPGAIDTLYVDPEMLARFTRVSRKSREPMRVTLTAINKPIYVHIGEHFMGAVMPARAPEGR